MTNACGCTHTRNACDELILACRSGNYPLAKLSIANGANINCSSTPLYEASIYGHIPIVELLLQEGANVNGFLESGYTPLFGAALGGHLDVVKLLLDSNAHVDALSNCGASPLFEAIAGGHYDIVELLIQYGADVNVCAIYAGKNTPLLVATRMCLNDPRKTVAIKIAELLLRNHVHVNESDSDGYTPLHLAAAKGNHEMLELLLCNGACVNSSSRKKETPIKLAIAHGHSDISNILVRHGAIPLSRLTRINWYLINSLLRKMCSVND